jgi:hypothetical protein
MYGLLTRPPPPDAAYVKAIRTSPVDAPGALVAGAVGVVAVVGVEPGEAVTGVVGGGGARVVVVRANTAASLLHADEMSGSTARAPAVLAARRKKARLETST